MGYWLYNEKDPLRMVVGREGGWGKRAKKNGCRREPGGETVRLPTVLFIGESLLTVLDYR